MAKVRAQHERDRQHHALSDCPASLQQRELGIRERKPRRAHNAPPCTAGNARSLATLRHSSRKTGRNSRAERWRVRAELAASRSALRARTRERASAVARIRAGAHGLALARRAPPKPRRYRARLPCPASRVRSVAGGGDTGEFSTCILCDPINQKSHACACASLASAIARTQTLDVVILFSMG